MTAGCCRLHPRCRWRWRVKRLLSWLFLVAVGYFVASTGQQRRLARPAHRSLCGEARQLDAAGCTLAVDGGGVKGSYSWGSSSLPQVSVCSPPVGSDDLKCQRAVSCEARLDSSMPQAVLSPSMAVASGEATRVALRRHRGLLCGLGSSAAMTGSASTPLVAW